MVATAVVRLADAHGVVRQVDIAVIAWRFVSLLAMLRTIAPGFAELGNLQKSASQLVQADEHEGGAEGK